MQKSLLLAFAIISSLFSFGQETDTVFIQLYGIGGGYGETSKGESLSYSMGETIVETVSNFNQTLTQGFQQSSFEAVVGVIEIEDITFDVQAYPNPTQDYLNIKISASNSDVNAQDYQVLFYDLTGKEISLEQNYEENQVIRIDLQYLPTGAYIARIIGNEKNNVISNFKITKTGSN